MSTQGEGTEEPQIGGVRASNSSDDKIKQMKRGYMIRATKRNILMSKLSTIERAIMNGNKIELQQLNLTLNEGLNDLQELDKKILNLMLDLEDTPDISNEMSEAGNVRIDIQTGILRLEAVLNASSTTAPGMVPDTPTPKRGEGTSAPKGGGIHTKLPKLQLQTFSGDPKNWQRFWDVFERNIHKNVNLEPIDKFDYLAGLLHGTAAKAIKGLK